MIYQGSAFTRSQGGEEEPRGPQHSNQNCGLAANQQFGDLGIDQGQASGDRDQYKAIFQQMMIWKY